MFVSDSTPEVFGVSVIAPDRPATGDGRLCERRLTSVRRQSRAPRGMGMSSRRRCCGFACSVRLAGRALPSTRVDRRNRATGFADAPAGCAVRPFPAVPLRQDLSPATLRYLTDPPPTTFVTSLPSLMLPIMPKNRPSSGRFHYWLPATQVTIYRCRFPAPCFLSNSISYAVWYRDVNTPLSLT